MSGLLIAGTTSDAGKSLVVTALCRALRRRGVDVVPYKAQNMSNNSMVCRDGGEIGRAQYLQAQGAGVEPSTAMNPVLLKPGTDRRSHVVLRGQPAGTLEAGQYATGRRALAEAAFAAFEELAAAHDLVIAEGAGSPAETNLRVSDYVNLGLARRFALPTVIVGDIDRGGMLAAVYGTWAILDDPADRACLAGYLVNKFRGDQTVLDPGLVDLTRRTGLPCYGVLPWLDGVWLDGEDALEVARWQPASPGVAGELTVAVPRFPRISNATDVDALAGEPGVRVVVTASPLVCRDADLVVLPGSRATVDDLGWLRRTGIADVVRERHAAGRPVLGICGGYQMLAHTIEDGLESGVQRADGLGLLPVTVEFGADKVLGRPVGTWQGHRVEGYEIHHGRCVVAAGAGEPFLDGVRDAATFGTLWHGAFENDDFRRAWLTEVATLAGGDWHPDPAAPGFADRREAMIDRLADALDRHCDVDALLALAREGRP